MSSQKNTGPASGTRKDDQAAKRAYQSEAELFGFDLGDDEDTADTSAVGDSGDATAATAATAAGQAAGATAETTDTSTVDEEEPAAAEEEPAAEEETEADAAEPSAGEATARDGDAGELAGPRRPAWLRLAAVALAVVGVAAAVWQGVGYFQDRQAQQRSELRDRLVDTTTQVLINAMSLEPDTFDQSMDYVRANSVGTFQSEYDQYDEQMRTYLEDNGIRTEAHIPNVAMSEIDTEHGLATAVVVYTVTAYKDEQLQAAARQALRISLEREGDGNDAPWKISEKAELGPMVPIGPSSQSVQDLDQLTGAGAAGGADGDSGTSAAPSSGTRKPETSAQPTSGASSSPQPTTSQQTGGR